MNYFIEQVGFFCFDLAYSLLCNAGYIWFVHRFCTVHFTCTERRKKPLLFFLTVSLPLLNLLILYGGPPSYLADLFLLLWQCMFLLCIILLYQADTAAKFLAALILLIVYLLPDHFITSLLSCLQLIIFHAMQYEPSLFIVHIMDCLYNCIHFSCVLWLIHILSKYMKTFFVNRISKWYLMLSIPLFGVVMLWNLIDIAASHGILFRAGDHWNLYYNQLFSHAGICILSALCMCGLSFYVFGMDRIDTEQRKKEQYLAQVNFYQMLGEQYRSLERLRHDMKNHIIGLQRLIDNQEWDKMSGYLQRMAQTGGLEYAEDLTGRNIVDALLYYKHNQAREAGIQWIANVSIPAECTVDEFDLCVILGNLLDNALEACKKPDAPDTKFIKIQGHMTKKCLLMEVTNSAKEPKSQKRRSTSSQRGNVVMGTGLRNVKDTVERYNGVLTIDNSTDCVFRVCVLLPTPASAP